ncbi:MAG: pyruvate formate lyase family protein [Candidatus Borkfalkiaceae bacterium]|nr:pyruvate formate lyase family protein [Clostridia bacterium]MDY6222555.1 pyruvate formate lyase family protein [Christensenellaceae bacterium]
MQFYTVSDTPRPVRLCETTRKFAYDSLHYQYGKDTWKTPNVILEDSDLPECASLIDKYDAAIKKIAETAPIRICKEERISGAATLGDAMRHYVPALYKGEYICFSVSHLTTDFKTVIEEGYSGLFERAKKSLAAYSGTDRERFLKSAILVLRSFETYHKRYLAALENRADKQENYRNLLRVPAFGATNFFEAVQSLWFTFSFKIFFTLYKR